MVTDRPAQGPQELRKMLDGFNRSREILHVAFRCSDAEYNRIWLRCLADPYVREFCAWDDMLKRLRFSQIVPEDACVDFHHLQDLLRNACRAVLQIVNDELGVETEEAVTPQDLRDASGGLRD